MSRESRDLGAGLSWGSWSAGGECVSFQVDMRTEFLVSCVAMIGSIVTTIPNNATDDEEGLQGVVREEVQVNACYLNSSA